MTVRVHGIPTCDTVKQARAWLGAHGVAHEWVDFRRSPPAVEDVARWCRAAGWQVLLNRRGTTWRSLDAATKAAVTGEATAVALMVAQPTLIKRPVIETDGEVLVGFSGDAWARRFERK